MTYVEINGIKKFLEDDGLYKKLFLKEPVKSIHHINYPSLKIFCEKCESIETFRFIRYNMPYKGVPASITHKNVIIAPNHPKKEVFTAEYKCAGCDENLHYFLIELSEKHDHITKLGQSSKMNLNIDIETKKILGKQLNNYKKALTCEFHGFGIGAFAYYRRVIEGIIDQLLESIENLFQKQEEKEVYLESLKNFKKTYIAAKKIKLVKNHLPNSLQSEPYNYLDVIYRCLSEGIHTLSDDQCFERSLILKNSITSLLVHINNSNTKELNDNIKKMLKYNKL